MTGPTAPPELPPADPGATLRQLDDLEGRGRSVRRIVRDLVKPDEEPVRVRVSRQHRGRRTGWGVTCPTHGVLPFLIPRRRAATAVGVDHVQTDHPEGGRVVVDEG